jgi:hypothetical protein
MDFGKFWVKVNISLRERKVTYLQLITSSDPKKGALGFFALRKIKFWEKALFLCIIIRKIKLNNFPRF